MKKTPLLRKQPLQAKKVWNYERAQLKRRATPKTMRNSRRKVPPTKVSLWRGYGLQRPAKPRFQGLQGVLWFCVSRYIRKLEFQQHGGECVDGCGRVITRWQDADCGHFRASSRGFCTRFVRENLGIQTKYCNNPDWSPDSSYGFGLTIDKRYGAGTAEKLKQLSHGTCQEYSQPEYDAEIRKYIALFEALQ